MNKIGDKILLAKQEVTVIACEKCGDLMVNIDANQLSLGDLTLLKIAGVKISNPETEEPICITCEHKTWGRKISDFFENTKDVDDDNDNNDDSHFFSSSGFLDGGGFGGFGGGSFGGGGAARSF